MSKVESGIPKCPKCGGQVLYHVKVSQYFYVDSLSRSKGKDGHGWCVSTAMGDLEDQFDEDKGEYECEAQCGKIEIGDLVLEKEK